ASRLRRDPRRRPPGRALRHARLAPPSGARVRPAHRRGADRAARLLVGRRRTSARGRGDLMAFTGGCRCGAIRHTCEAEPPMMVNCYCRDCQYASGGACTTAVVTLADSLPIEGTPKAYTTTADSG